MAQLVDSFVQRKWSMQLSRIRLLKHALLGLPFALNLRILPATLSLFAHSNQRCPCFYSSCQQYYHTLIWVHIRILTGLLFVHSPMLYRAIYWPLLHPLLVDQCALCIVLGARLEASKQRWEKQPVGQELGCLEVHEELFPRHSKFRSQSTIRGWVFSKKHLPTKFRLWLKQ